MKLTSLFSVILFCLVGCGASGGSSSSTPTPAPAGMVTVQSLTYVKDVAYSSPTPYAYITIKFTAIDGATQSTAATIYQDGAQIGLERPIAPMSPGDVITVKQATWNSRAESASYPGPWVESHVFRVVVPGVMDESFTVNYIVRVVTSG